MRCLLKINLHATASQPDGVFYTNYQRNATTQTLSFITLYLFNKTPAQAFTLPAEKKWVQTGHLCTTAHAGVNMKSTYLFKYLNNSTNYRYREFLGLKVGGGLDFQIWDLN